MANTIAQDSLLSKTINALRFPMCVLIIFIHANQGTTDMLLKSTAYLKDSAQFNLFTNISTFISVIVANIAVPTFFLISGFLFFYSNDGFSFIQYKTKLKSRFYTIMIPYISWNLIFALLYFAAQTLAGNFVSDSHKLFINYNFKDWADLFWCSKDFWNNPIDLPLWYIRDLMGMMVLSPFVYLFVKYLRKYGIVILCLLWIFGSRWPISIFEQTAILFFTVGAFFGTNKIDFVTRLKPYLYYLIVGYCIMLLAIFIFNNYSECLRLSVIIGIMLVVALFARLVEHGDAGIVQSKFLSSSTFFIYAFHALPVIFVIKIIGKILPVNSNVHLLFIYFFSVFFIIIVGLCLYKIVNQSHFAKTILTGNR